MMTDKKFLLFIILSYNGYDDTVACIRSLENKIPPGGSILVIDNASSPPLAEPLMEAFPNIEIIPLPENRGWAGGNNFGIRLALERGYKWVCLLNNDTEFPEGGPQKWYTTLEKLPPALVHPAIYYWDDPEVPQLDPSHGQDSCAGQRWHGMIPLDYAYGACLAVHRSIFERTGILDERFFLQLEETDFYHRALNAGYLSVCDPSVKIYHKESRAFGGKRTAIKSYYIARNSLLIIEKRKGSLLTKSNLMKQYYWMMSHAAAQDMARKPGLYTFFSWFVSKSKHARAVRTGILHYLFRIFGKIPYSTAEKLK